MKKILGFCFVLLSLGGFAQNLVINTNTNPANSCFNPYVVCGKYDIDRTLKFSNIDECNRAIKPYYFKMKFSGSGTFSLLTPGGYVGGSGVNTIHSGYFTLYGPFQSIDYNTCVNIESGSIEGLTADLTGTNFINHEQGYYLLKVEVRDCIRMSNHNNNWGIMIAATSDLLDCERDTKEPEKPNCIDCISSFSPNPGKYTISGWVKEKATTNMRTYENPEIEISFAGSNSNFIIQPSGIIIDGWQKIEGEVIVPANATDIKIELNCKSGSCYYDDIRFSPVNGSMKSYVYDPVSLRLVAELDERNYATFYEYDEEGKLIRVKKETEKGIMTIQENRNNIKKR